MSDFSGRCTHSPATTTTQPFMPYFSPGDVSGQNNALSDQMQHSGTAAFTDFVLQRLFVFSRVSVAVFNRALHFNGLYWLFNRQVGGAFPVMSLDPGEAVFKSQEQR